MKQIVWAMVFVLLAGAMAQAQSVPPLVNYQGMLTDAAGKPQPCRVGMKCPPFHQLSELGFAGLKDGQDVAQSAVRRSYLQGLCVSKDCSAIPVIPAYT